MILVVDSVASNLSKSKDAEKTTMHKSGKSKSFVMMSTVSELSNRKWKLMMTMRS